MVPFRYSFLAVLFLISTLLAQSSGLRLDTSLTRSEFTAGDKFTIVAYLFNDTDTDTSGTISIVAPEGFKVLSAEPVTGTVPAHNNLGAYFSYEVLDTTPKGIYWFTVFANGMSAREVLRVGPIEAPSPVPPVFRRYMPLMFNGYQGAQKPVYRQYFSAFRA